MGINQQAFINAVREYRDKTGNNLGQVALLLGLSPSTLRSYTYAKGRLPGLALVTRAAALFGCPVAQFIDDAGDTENVSTMFRDLQSLTPEQMESVRNIIKASKALPKPNK